MFLRFFGVQNYKKLVHHKHLNIWFQRKTKCKVNHELYHWYQMKRVIVFTFFKLHEVSVDSGRTLTESPPSYSVADSLWWTRFKDLFLDVITALLLFMLCVLVEGWCPVPWWGSGLVTVLKQDLRWVCCVSGACLASQSCWKRCKKRVYRAACFWIHNKTNRHTCEYFLHHVGL